MLILIKQMYGQIIIPQAVYDELGAFSNQKQIVDDASWIKIRRIKNTKLVGNLRETLDQGEAEAIVLALETKSALLVIDELKGRIVAREYGLKIIGILGVLINAKKRGLIPSVKIYMDQLINVVGFHVSRRLYTKVLQSVGEKEE
jgi:predicted nucleic acid-binding protein